MKTVYFRADMNNVIATGHMMRCLSIADQLRIVGGKAVFILADENACELLKTRGYEYIVLNSEWNDLEFELPKMVEVIDYYKIKHLLIDSYFATELYLSELSKLANVVYIDDMNRTDLRVNTIISYAVYSDTDFYKKHYDTSRINLLIGTDYAPLRSAFCSIPERRIKEHIENVLILSGGTDPYNTISECIDALCESSKKRIHAICGRYSDQADYLKNRFRKYNNVCILESVNNIEEYMLQADLCISAAGTTLYELCACGTPTLSYVIADNQIDNAKGFDKKGIIPCIGDKRDKNGIDSIKEEIGKMESFTVRKDISTKMRKLIDGRGCERIIKDSF